MLDTPVKALESQDVMISTVGLFAQAQQYKLVDAAVEAGVKALHPK